MAELKDITNHESVVDQINQYRNLISLTADQLQDLKARVKSLNNGDYSSELDSINEAQQKLYEALKSLELE
ncbi:hypothetical protein PS385_08875 [Limosilactobacillus fermentum]|uniref:hypothetical protein n=1 Tax=Limosilactobacillus fermentum TaxID=1613 RepID=UPI00128AFBA2|nr:hypothetical protein [Limosilactobacillus fermentum]MPW02615.1 hypothetical protein [Limosilactobacillus fermentum]